MAEQKIVLEFTEQEIHDLDAMCTTGYRLLRDDATDEQRAAALAIVHRIDANRRAILAGEQPPDAAPAPQVFFPGDTVPSGRRVLAEDGRVHPEPAEFGDGIPWEANFVTVEVLSPAEWQSAVDRARQAREGGDSG